MKQGSSPMQRRFRNIALVALLVGAGFFAPAPRVSADTVSEINAQIQAKQKQVDDLKRQMEVYQKAIAEKQGQATQLKNQLAILEDQIAKAELSIKANELKLNTTTLQVQSVTLEIAAKERALSDQRVKVAGLLRELNIQDKRSVLEIAVLNPSLGDFFEQLNYLESLQGELQTAINRLDTMKTALLRRQQDLANYRLQLIQNKNDLKSSQSSLASQQQSKQSLLQATKSSEGKFQSLFFQTLAEQEQASKDIQGLEQEARRRLNLAGQTGQLGGGTFIWPVRPYKGISTYFHDPTYIFRRYFEHPGIDIPQPQGTPIKAAAAGYVARAKDAGLGYSYIMIVHKDGLATVYGHVSRISVQEDTFVTQGQIIGASGGAPGTRGAGPLTTGPHLHFEIRQNGIPVNPLDYLSL